MVAANRKEEKLLQNLRKDFVIAFCTLLAYVYCSVFYGRNAVFFYKCSCKIRMVIKTAIAGYFNNGLLGFD